MAPKSKMGSPTGSPGELAKEIELISISDLEDKLARSRRRCRALEAANKHYQEQFEQLEDDRRDVVTFLKRTLEQRADEILELQERLNGVTQTLDVERKSHEEHFKQITKQFQESKEQMIAQITVLTGKLNTLEEFKLQKGELLAKFSKLEAKLEFDQEKFKEDLYQMERKNILDKDKMKKDLLHRVNQIAADFRKVSNKQMADTTKRMMRENVNMSVTLTKISEKTAELVEENRKLKSQYHSRQLKISMLEATEMELVKKNRSHMRVIKLLNAKCNAQELVIGMFEDLHEKFIKLLEEVQTMFHQCEAIQGELTALEERHGIIETELNNTSIALMENEKKLNQLEVTVTEAARAILECLQLDTGLEPYDKYEAQGKRSVLLIQLLNLLGKATVGLSKNPDFGTVGLFKELKSYADHYKLGDLGLIGKIESGFNGSKALSKREKGLFGDDDLEFSKGDLCICTQAMKKNY
uniref:Cilia- and flagella-associated protein 157 n=1 Tax=Strigamia maritima TaxID=126957 RepID=T1J223_STRMM